MQLSHFPKSFHLLQQEALLADSLILSGFEHLVKGNFDDKGKGAYYSSFFSLSIGFERIMKLVIISDFMVNNNYKSYDSNLLRKKYGHDLCKLFKSCSDISSQYGIDYKEVLDSSINKHLLIFLTDFAAAQKGRYFNISSDSKHKDPLIAWEELFDEIAWQDFSEATWYRLENKIFNNMSINLQLQDLAFNTGYVESVKKYQKSLMLNRYALLRIKKILEPIAETLCFISNKSNEVESNSSENNYSNIPNFSEFFLFRYSDKSDVMRRKRWTDLFYS